MSFRSARRSVLKRARKAAGSQRIDVPTSIRAKVGLADQDIFGHMTNTRYNAFALLAFEDLLIRSGANTAATKAGATIKILREDVVFVRMLKFPDAFKVDMHLAEIKNDQLVFRHVFRKKDRLITTGAITATIVGPDGERRAVRDILPDLKAGSDVASAPGAAAHS
ncbi:MAG: acyl-CoA thioesterase [Pseudomonadota bacterium]